MLRPACALLVILALLVSPALAERKGFFRPSRAEQIRELHGPHNSAAALQPAAQRTPLINDLPPLSKPVTAPPVRSEVHEPPAAMMAEILKIRRATQTVDPAEEAEFVEALQEVAGVKKAATAPNFSPLQGDGEPEPFKLKKRAMSTSSELVDSLQQSARQLDTVAANYEERGEFELADKARHMAHHLRQEARGLMSNDVRSSLLPSTDE